MFCAMLMVNGLGEAMPVILSASSITIVQSASMLTTLIAFFKVLQIQTAVALLPSLHTAYWQGSVLAAYEKWGHAGRHATSLAAL